MTDKVVIKNLFKVFGNNPEQAIKMVRDGIPKAEIFAQTGQTVGVMDALYY